MSKEDYMLICGDFGGVWDGGKEEQRLLDRLEQLPFTILFVSGNHENYDLLMQLPVEEWNGGKIQRVRPHIIHLMRGQIFTLEGKTFFTLGGASCHDIDDGILDPGAPGFQQAYRRLCRRHAMFRVNHYSWWKQELPSEEEYAEARRNLEKAGWKVDYIITHCAPDSIEDLLDNGSYFHDDLTRFLEEVRQKTQFHAWLFGHYHDNRVLEDRFYLLYEQMVRIL